MGDQEPQILSSVQSSIYHRQLDSPCHLLSSSLNNLFSLPLLPLPGNTLGSVATIWCQPEPWCHRAPPLSYRDHNLHLEMLVHLSLSKTTIFHRNLNQHNLHGDWFKLFRYVQPINLLTSFSLHYLVLEIIYRVCQK